MKKYILILSLLIIPLFSTAQNKPPSKTERRHLANDNFDKLQGGALLVRLKRNQRKINALRENGYIAEANALQMSQDLENKEIIRSFKHGFSFCDTYFFYSDYSNSVRNKDFSKPIFLNENLEIDPSIEFVSEEFLTAEFGHVMQDTASYRHNVIIERDNSGVRRKSSNWGGPDFRFGALIVMSDEFVQLCKPFPAYVRTFDSLPFLRRATHQVVARLNEKLFNYASY